MNPWTEDEKKNILMTNNGYLENLVIRDFFYKNSKKTWMMMEKQTTSDLINN